MTAQRVVPVSSPLLSVLTTAKKGLAAVLTAIVGTLVSVSPLPVEAALLDGQTVEATDFHGTAPDQTTIIGPVNRVVGPGVELTNFGFGDFVNIDFSDTSILITLMIDQPFGFFEILRFFDVNGTIPAFTGVTVNPATNWTDFDPAGISFNSDRIDVPLPQGGLQGQQILLNLIGGTNGGNGVSEPPAYLLVGLGVLSMLGIASGRRKKAL